MIKEMETVILKVKLRRGSIYTINVSEQNNEFISGTDKFGYPIKVKMSDIETMFPVTTGKKEVTNGK